MPLPFSQPPANYQQNDIPFHWKEWHQAIYRKMKSWFSFYYNVKDYGALGDGSNDDTAAINAAIADINVMGKGTLWFPQGQYKITASTTAFTCAATVRGSGSTVSTIQTDVASTACITFNATTDLFGIEVCDIGFDSPTGAASTIGLKFTASSGKYIALAKIHDVHGTGVEAVVNVNMTTTIVSGAYNVIPFSNNNFVNLTVTKNTGGKYPKYGIKWDSGCGPHNVVSSCNFQLSNVAGSAGIIAGDGTAGLGDFIVTGCHFNLCIDGIKLTGPTTLSEYRNHILVTGCQFDGNITNGCTFSKIQDYQIVNCLYGFGVGNSLTGVGTEMGGVEINNIESRYSFRKDALTTVGAIAQDVAKVAQLSSSTYSSAMVEISVGGLVGGVSAAHSTYMYHISWNASVPTTTLVNSYETPAGIFTISTSTVANAVKFTINATSASQPSNIYGNIRVVSENHFMTML